MIVVSGSRPTGKLHLGHFMTIGKWLEFQNKADKSYFFVADWHALTSHRDDVNTIESSTLDLVRHYLAMGVDPKKSTIFVQSAIKEHAELYLLFSMLVSTTRLERMPTFKDMKENIKDKDLSTLGFLGYPVLQAADILTYMGDTVPVGEDQIYHVEFTREIARKFNNLYEEIFPEPEAYVASVPKLPGTDGRKMSKSYGNSIIIETEEKDMSKQIMQMKTDPARMRRTDPGDPEKCPVWDFHKAFTNSEEEKNWVINGCKTAEIGCIQCKKVLFKNMKEQLEPVWNNLKNISNDDAKKIILDGNEKARSVAEQTLKRVRNAMKLRW
ncbi:tryptophan--tRNA ligase [Tepiditoga spiralis]|uniref:Tryptophan--tRNA ligase n=1 Tax=Tepiditoga spiralis TaxID=2108365 RepID=A0A7G1GBH1_9BACT|nr:tryptophan--tRNA ligase [Tepiditoga spiralis]BBE31069.1 tryptophan--tRNA ligase [Tepiditoga spiralis]